MIRFRRLGYLALNVSDLEQSSAFYERTVGLQKVEGPTNGTPRMPLTGGFLSQQEIADIRAWIQAGALNN